MREQLRSRNDEKMTIQARAMRHKEQTGGSRNQGEEREELYLQRGGGRIAGNLLE